MSLDAEFAKLAVDGVRALAAYLWGRLTGETHTEDAAKAIEAIKRRALEAAADAALAELQVLANAAGLRFASEELAANARDLVEAIFEAEKVGRERMDFPPERVELAVDRGEEDGS